MSRLSAVAPGTHKFDLPHVLFLLYAVLYVKPDSPRLPKAMRESGAKYCGHRSVLTLPEPTVGVLGLSRVDWGTWLTGMACGAVLTLITTRMMQPKYKRMR